jgi:hypothetical protein
LVVEFAAVPVESTGWEIGVHQLPNGEDVFLFRPGLPTPVDIVLHSNEFLQGRIAILAKEVPLPADFLGLLASGV